MSEELGQIHALAPRTGEVDDLIGQVASVLEMAGNLQHIDQHQRDQGGARRHGLHALSQAVEHRRDRGEVERAALAPDPQREGVRLQQEPEIQRGRAYALGQGAGAQVLVLLPWMLISGESGGRVRDLLMTLSWAINLGVAEWIIRRRQHGR